MPQRDALAFAGFMLALLAVILSAASAWDALTARVDRLERVEQFLHGDIQMPRSR